MNQMIIPGPRLTALYAIGLTVSVFIGTVFAASDSISGAPDETMEGRVVALAVDDLRAGSERTIYYVNDPRGPVEVSFPNGSPRPGTVVRVTGARVGHAMVARQWEVQRLAEATTTSNILAGEQKVAILLVSLPSIPLLSAATPALLQSTYFGPGRSVDSFLRELSFGKAWASGQVYGPFVLDADYIGQPLAIRDAAIRAASGQVNFQNFNRLVLVVPQSSAGLESGGLGSIGSETIQTPGGPVTVSTTWLGDASVGSPQDLLAAACHELGHNFGLEHARASDFGAEPLGPPGQLPAPWSQILDYGDCFSNMARGLGHWAAPQKSALGWLLGGTDFATVETNGAFVLQPYEVAGAGLKAIRVRRGTGNDAWLWLEYRQPTAGSLDSDLPPSASTGALVHYEDAGWNDTQVHSNLLRFNPDNGLPFGNAPLTAGSSWADPYSNLTLTVGQNVTGGLHITVSYAPAPSDPSALTPQNSHVAAAGATLSLTVVASAGYAWTAVSSVPWIAVTAGASGIGNGRITLSVAPAASTSTRWGRIVVGSAVAIVTQDGLDGNVRIDPSSAAVAAAGGTGEIAVSANADDYAWSYTVDVPWIQSVFFSKLMSTGSGTLRYIVAQNTDTASRTGTIHIGGQVFTVTQSAGGPLISQLTWTRLTTSNAPISRHSMGMAAYTSRGESVFYGGCWDTTLMGDTWVWSGSDWTQRTPAHSPGLLSGHAMAYDAGHDQVVLFGGSNLVSTNGTWIWNGVDWTQLYPRVLPGERTDHAMVYNPVSKRVILFGGFDNQGVLGDTWEWDGSSWTQRFSTISPPARSGAAMVYDAARDEVVLFGGIRQQGVANPVFLNDTWTWDGLQWRQKTPVTSPTPRTGARMEYNPQLGLVVLIGGAGGKDMKDTPANYWVYDYREETWTWDGVNWTQRFPATSPEFSWTYGLVYDAVHQAFTAHLGDDLHCADRGPRSYVLQSGPGALLLNSYRTVVPLAGGSGSIAVTGTVPWVATSDSWITLSGATGVGNGTLGYVVGANAGTASRNGRIVVGDKVFVIAQPGAVAPPAITAQPQSQVRPTGTTATFAVVTTGTAPLSYQWRNGAANLADGGTVSGATSATLTLANIQVADTGSYSVVVTNATGTVISNVATLTAYVPAAVPASQSVMPGSSVMFAVAAGGSGSPTYQWKLNGAAIAGATGATYTVANAQAGNMGFYAVAVTNNAGSVDSAVAILTVSGGSSRLTALSTRGYVPAGGALTSGFYLRGSGSKSLIVRGVGPTLGGLGVAGPLSDPKMDLIPVNGPTLFSNDDWGTNANLPALRVAAPFPLVEGSKDAAALATLSTATNSGYTVRIVPSGTATAGIAMAEAYDLDATTAPVKFTSLSTLGYTGPGDNVLTPGFIISGDGPKQLLIRAVGPTLGTAYNVPGVLADPQFVVIPLGKDFAVASNDNWGGTAELQAAFVQANDFALPVGSKDAAVVVRLPPGGYTVQATGVGNTAGNVLVEIYDMDP